MTRTAVPLVALLVLGAGPLQMALLVVSGSLAILLVGFVAGALVDRQLRRPLLIWADAIRAIVLFAFLAALNDFIAPLILISDSTKLPLPLAIASLRQQTMGAIDYGATEAGVVVMALPCLFLFLILQRYYVRGFLSGAIKG